MKIMLRLSMSLLLATSCFFLSGCGGGEVDEPVKKEMSSDTDAGAGDAKAGSDAKTEGGSDSK